MNMPESPRPIISIVILLLLLLALVTHGEVIVDQSFSPQLGSNAAVNAIALESNGNLIVGGSFTHSQGAPANYLGRYNKDGVADDAFNFNATPNGVVSSIALTEDGRIVIFGDFSKVA